MSRSGETCCPDCGGHNAVSKAAAWDAAATVPPKTANRLKRLEEIERAAMDLIADKANGDEPEVCVAVPRRLLNGLRDALKGGAA